MSASPSLTSGDEFDAEAAVRTILKNVLSLTAATAEGFTADSPLFGALPEIDSMAVAGLLTEMEDRLNIVIDDDEVDADLFSTFGTLVRFAERKVAG